MRPRARISHCGRFWILCPARPITRRRRCMPTVSPAERGGRVVEQYGMKAMAGHSQFKNIMHRKGRQDAVKSKLFGKLAREITVSAKLGVPDPAMNARLRAAV